jgi:diacylglycerol O-acyltransferase / wax synthase
MAPARLSHLDASFLRIETPAAHMHVAWRGRFRPPAGGRGTPITLARVRSQVARRLDAVPRFRQRLAYPVGGVGEPAWVDDPGFRVEQHVLALSAPEDRLSPARFDALCDAVLSSPLSRHRPLWSLHVAPALADGTTGILMRAHHAMVDGASALALALLLLDGRPGAPVPLRPPAPWTPEPAPSPVRLTLDALAEAGTEPLRAGGRPVRAVATGPGRSRIADTLRRTALAVGDDMLHGAPPSFLNRPIGPRRALVGHVAAIEPLLAARRAHGVSLNDLALAAVAGALRRLARAQHEPVVPMKVIVPVSRRVEPDAATPGNRLAFVSVELPLHLGRPEARLQAVRAQTVAFKAGRRAEGGAAVLEALGALPGPLQTQAARLASSARAYNLVVSNVTGPRFPVHLLGAECEEVLPAVPLSAGHALSVGVFSLRDSLCLSAYADPDALPAVGELPGALADSLEELASVAIR